MRHAPIERVLLETDSPVSYGQGEDGFRAEPKDVFRTLKAYAEFKKISQQEAQAIVIGNAKDFFGIA
mgnify:CR=1 FL=1